MDIIIIIWPRRSAAIELFREYYFGEICCLIYYGWWPTDAQSDVTQIIRQIWRYCVFCFCFILRIVFKNNIS